MDERSKEAYEDVLDGLVFELRDRELEKIKNSELWLKGTHPDDKKLVTLSPGRTKDRNRRMSTRCLAEAEAYEMARLAIENLLKEKDQTPLSQVQLTEFEALVYDAFKNPEALAPKTRMIFQFRHMSIPQRRQAWAFVSGREPPPTEIFEHQGFLASTLKDLLPEV